MSPNPAIPEMPSQYVPRAALVKLRRARRTRNLQQIPAE
jgi:hypothetical protein